MAYTFPWDETFPPGTQSADQINEDLQRILVQVRERFTDILGISFPNTTAQPVTATKLVLQGSATSKIIPGATSFSIRNNADNADNLLVNDNGNVIPRNNIGNSNYSLVSSANQGSLTLQATAGGSVGWTFSANTSDRLTLTRISGSQIFSVDPAGPVTFGFNLIISTGGLTVSAGGLTVSAGGATIGGNSSIVGTLLLNGGAGSSLIEIRGAAGNKRSVFYTTGGSVRWEAQCTNTAEGGGNSGSDYVLSAYDDSGTFISNALIITRSNRLATFGSDVTITHGNGPSVLNISNPANQDRLVNFQTSGVNRFRIGIGSGVESGSNAGADILFRACDDAGGTIADFLTVVRATGIVTFGKAIVIIGNVSPSSDARKSANVDNRFYRLTNTEASGKQWDLIVDSVANGSRFGIYDHSDGVYGLQISPNAVVTIGAQTSYPSAQFTDSNSNILEMGWSGNQFFYKQTQATQRQVVWKTASTNVLILDYNTGFLDSKFGILINGAAATGNYLRGDGTKFTASTLQAADIPSPLNQSTFQVNSGATVSRLLTGSVAFNPGTFSAGSFQSTAITVTGAQVGDAVFCNNPYLADNFESVVCNAYVSGANTVTYVIKNTSGGNITLTNRTIKVWVIG